MPPRVLFLLQLVMTQSQMPEPVNSFHSLFFCQCPGCLWTFRFYFHNNISNLGTMFLTQCLWVFSFDEKTMVIASCFQAFNYICHYSSIPCIQPNYLSILLFILPLYDLHPLKGFCHYLASSITYIRLGRILLLGHFLFL